MVKRNDLIVPQGCFAYVLNQLTGATSVLVGPIINRMDDEKPVVYDPAKKRLVGCPIERAIQPAIIVPEGQHAVISAPCFAEDGSLSTPRPKQKTPVEALDLRYGTKLNLPGPSALIPWPGQSVEVLHPIALLPNQYLRVVVKADMGQESWDELCALDPNDANYPAVPKIGIVMIIGGNRTPHFVPSPSIDLLTKTAQTAAVLEPYQYAIFNDGCGKNRYVRGTDTSVAFPLPHETYVLTTEATDLRKCGVLVRSQRNDDFGKVEFRTNFKTESPRYPDYYWPDNEEELLRTVDPVKVPKDGGVYARVDDGPDVQIIRTTGCWLPDPTRIELMHREKSYLAVPLVVDVNHVARIKSATNTRYVVGPQTVLLEYDETLAGQKSTTKRMESSFEIVATDASSFNVQLTYDLRLAGENMFQWFEQSTETYAYMELQRRVQVIADKHPSTWFLDHRTELAGLLLDENTAKIDLDFVHIDNLYVGSVRLHDDEIAKLCLERRRLCTRTRLQEDVNDAQRTAEVVKADHNKIMQELELSIAQAKHAAATEIQKLKVATEQAEVEHDNKIQELRNALAALCREADVAHNAADIEKQRKLLALELDRLEAQTQATIRTFEAVQPELVAAITAAGSQAHFGNVVQHLGPTALIPALLQNVGLSDVLQKLGAGTVLSLPTEPKKPNGTAKPNI